jgi:hypothetical protein
VSFAVLFILLLLVLLQYGGLHSSMARYASLHIVLLLRQADAVLTVPFLTLSQRGQGAVSRHRGLPVRVGAPVQLLLRHEPVAILRQQGRPGGIREELVVHVRAIAAVGVGRAGVMYICRAAVCIVI